MSIFGVQCLAQEHHLRYPRDWPLAEGVAVLKLIVRLEH